MNIQQVMMELDSIRRRRNTAIAIITAFGVIALFGFIGFCTNSDSDQVMTLLIGFSMVFSLVIFGSFCVVKDLDKKARAIYKSTLVPMVMSNRLGYVEYYSQCGFSVQSVQEAGLISNLNEFGNSFYAEDYMRGNYAGVDFRQSDINIKYVSQKNEQVQLFYGRVFEFDYIGKNVPELVICTQNYRHHPGLYNYYPVKLESENFNQRFKVFTCTPHDAFYMLTPQMMEKLMMLWDRYDSFALRFTNNRLYVAIHGLNSFEVDLNKKLDYNFMMMSFDSDVQTIIDLIYVINCLPKNV